VSDDRPSVLTALAQLRRQVRWRADKDPAELHQRVRVLSRLGHLPLGATLATLEAIIAAAATDLDVQLFRSDSGSLALLSSAPGRPWIVVFDPAGAVETAFPSADPTAYLAAPRFIRLGALRDLEVEPGG
jgi:hypothetical protein